MNFEHQVPEDIRKASTFDPADAVYIAPDGRAWVYTDDPRGEGASWRDSSGEPISVAVWCKE